MALHWRPVGPEPETTYWQRRAVVALSVLVPLLLLLTVLGGGGDEDRLGADSQATARPVDTAPPAALASAEPGPTTDPTASPTPQVLACAPEALTVTAAATEKSYTAGSSAKLELRVATTGAVPCTADLGRGAVELLVFSGGDRIWSSDDCAPGGDPEIKTLQPGVPDVSRVTWPGVRSAPGCKGSKAKAQPGTYRVAARVGDRRVEGEPFVLKE